MHQEPNGVLHRPVMVREVIEGLNPSPGKVIVDATIDGGGHAKEILDRIIPGGRLIGIDCDESALKIAHQSLMKFTNSIHLVRDNFRDISEISKGLKILKVDGALFDLGLSSYQLEDPTRGFGIRRDSPLDMRMDTRRSLSALQVVNRSSEKDLADIIYRFGEERYSRRIAKAILSARRRQTIKTTGELAKVIEQCVGPRYKKAKIHPATRSFQAIRIAVNDELRNLEAALREVVEILAAGARICVISFHSLEDRIVKNIFKEFSRMELLKIITKKPLRPSSEEIKSNPRSRSARLRVSERL